MKLGRIVGEQGGDRFGHGLRGGIGVEPVPDVEQQGAARPQHPARLAIGGDPVGEEHRSELADDEVEAGVGKRQRLSVGRREGDPRRIDLGLGHSKHVGIEVGRDDLSLRQGSGEGGGDDSGAGRGLQDPAGPQRRGAPRQVLGIGLEQEGPEAAMVEFRDRAGEGGVRGDHG